MALLAAMLATGTAAAPALDLVLPQGAVASAEERVTPGSYQLPTGAYRDGAIPGPQVEGTVVRAAWKVPGRDLTTLALLAPLRDQLRAGGFEILFECETQACGGFDFRFATPILPEPDMHVDLGDFRFLSARRGTEALGLMVSRSSAEGFVQITHVVAGPAGAAPPAPAPSETAPDPARPILANPAPATLPQPGTPPLVPGTPPDTPLAQALSAGGSVVLQGLTFASGSASLEAGTYVSLEALADWLRANPSAQVAIVGHTDASGGLQANIALSKRRAESVRAYLVGKDGIGPDRISAEGAGYLAPIASNLTPEGREKNRRVEVMMTSTQLKP